MKDLEAVQRKVIDLYEGQRYREGLNLSRSVQETYPANASYWSACFLSLMGKPEESLTTLERALEAGCWWSPLALRRDPDLEPLRDDGRFTGVVAASEERWRATFRDEPELLTFPPKGASAGVLLIALHGSPAFSLDDFVTQWEPLSSLGIALVVPRSTQAANSDGGATWDDRAQMERDVRLAFERAKNRFATTRVVIGGFSAGGEAAITATVTGRPAIGPIGFFAVGAGIRPELLDALGQADPSLRGWIIVGEKDFGRETVVSPWPSERAWWVCRGISKSSPGSDTRFRMTSLLEPAKRWTSFCRLRPAPRGLAVPFRTSMAVSGARPTECGYPQRRA